MKLIDAASLTNIEREWGTKLARNLLRNESPLNIDQQIIEKADSCEWRNLMLMAFESLRRNDESEAEYWLNLASSRVDVTGENHGLSPPWFLMMHPNGDATISWSPPYWKFRKDSANGTVHYDQQNDELNLAYESQANPGKRLIYSFTGPIFPDRWDALELNANLSSDTFLIFTLHTNQGAERKIVNQRGTDNWEKYLIPINDNKIRFIYIAIYGPANVSTTATQSAKFQPLKLISNSDSNGCFPSEL